MRRHNLSSGMPQTQREESRLTLLPLVPGAGLPCSPCVSPADTPPMFLANVSTASVGGFPTQKSSPASPLLGSSPNSSAWLLHPTASHAFPAWAGFQCSDPSVCLCPLSWRCSGKGLLSHSDPGGAPGPDPSVSFHAAAGRVLLQARHILSFLCPKLSSGYK